MLGPAPASCIRLNAALNGGPYACADHYRLPRPVRLPRDAVASQTTPAGAYRRPPFTGPVVLTCRVALSAGEQPRRDAMASVRSKIEVGPGAIRPGPGNGFAALSRPHGPHAADYGDRQATAMRVFSPVVRISSRRIPDGPQLSNRRAAGAAESCPALDCPAQVARLASQGMESPSSETAD